MSGDWIDLFNGKDLTGWHMRNTDRDHKWVVQNGILDNTATGVDIVSDVDCGDHELHIEYVVPEGSNSGIYLRGRYEIQMLDSYGKTYDRPSENGALYLVKKPDVEVSRPAGEWQTLEVTLVGLNLTASLNGHTIHDNVQIEGPTGSNWLAKDNASPAPHFLQGDHSAALFRNIRIRNL